MFDCKKFGQMIRSLRKENNKTILEMSLELGISDSYLGLIERCQKIPSTEIVILLLNYYNLSFEDSFISFNYETNKLDRNIKDKLYLFDSYDYEFLYNFLQKIKEDDCL